MKYITFLNVGIKLFFTITIFLFLEKKENYWIYPLLQSLGFIIAGLVAQYIVIKKYRVRFVRIRKKYIKHEIISNFPIFVNQFMPVLYNNSSSFLLGLIVSSTAAGIFDALKKIVDLVIMIIGVISRVFFPFLNKNKDFFGNYQKILFVIVGSLIIVMLTFSRYIFSLLTITYENAFQLLLLFTIGIIGITIYDIYATSYLIVRRQDKLVMQNTLYVSLIGFIISFPLIYYFEIVGGAISLSLSRLLLGMGSFYLYLNYKRI